RRGIAATTEARGVDDDDVAALPHLERADLRVEAQRTRALARRHEQSALRGEGALAVEVAGEEAGHPRFLESIEPVVARRAVGTEADDHARPGQAPDIGDARAELEV